MCNLFNVTTQEMMIQWARALRDVTGNLEPSIDIYPDHLVLIGLPSSKQALHQPASKRADKPRAKGKPVDQKAMPTILTTREEMETWLTASWEEAKALQWPPPDDKLVMVSPSARIAA